MRQVYIIKTRKNVFITSDITINACRVNDDNARTIASLASSPPVVSGVAITAATVAPSSSALTTSSLVAGTALRLASTDDGTPPAMSSLRWRMTTTTTTTTTTTAARGVWRPPRRLDRRGRTNSPPPPDRRPFAPTSTVVLSFPRGPPGRIVPAPGEVERRYPPRAPVRGSSGPSSESVPSRHWRFFVLPVVVRVCPPPLPSFHPPSPPPPPLAPSPRRLPRVVAFLRR